MVLKRIDVVAGGIRMKKGFVFGKHKHSIPGGTMSYIAQRLIGLCEFRCHIGNHGENGPSLQNPTTDISKSPGLVFCSRQLFACMSAASETRKTRFFLYRRRQSKGIDTG
jgi:hypothetical protein